MEEVIFQAHQRPKTIAILNNLAWETRTTLLAQLTAITKLT